MTRKHELGTFVIEANATNLNRTIEHGGFKTADEAREYYQLHYGELVEGCLYRIDGPNSTTNYRLES